MRYNQYWMCITPWCSAEQWLVQAMPRQRDIWHIRPIRDGRSWKVAATQPICPLCGVNLEAAPILATTVDTAEYDVVRSG